MYVPLCFRAKRFFLLMDLLHTPTARYRYRQGVLSRTQERRARPDQLGGPRRAQEPANSQDR
jgi:hypothetical protein